jgi:hypothetical protein
MIKESVSIRGSGSRFFSFPDVLIVFGAYTFSFTGCTGCSFPEDELAAVAQWLMCCATNRKVAGSIPDGVIGIFH